MAKVFKFVNDDEDPDEHNHDESNIDRPERAANIMGIERKELILALAAPAKRRIVDIAKEFDRPAQVISNFKFRNKREILEMRRLLDSKTADLYYAAQVHRIGEAQRHLALIEDQLREMLESSRREEEPIPLDVKEFRGLVAEANKIRKEIREETKPTMSIGEIQFTPPKGYGKDDKGWFGEETEEPT